MAASSDSSCAEVMGEPDPSPEGFADVASFSQTALKTVLIATKHANALPGCGDEFDYYSSFKSFRKIMKGEGQKILKLMTSVVRHNELKGNMENLDQEEKFDFLADVNDTLVERIGTAIDEATGKRKTEADSLVLASITARDIARASWNKKSISTTHRAAGYRLLAAKNIMRPQLKFRDKIDNSTDPFVPVITEKPNSIKPLSIILEPTENGIAYSHPYQCELDHFKPTAEQLQEAKLQEPNSVESTRLIFVRTTNQVADLLVDLKREKEVAIDLEHHSYRTFQGITCLMQISTRRTDYLVDTLELRNDLQVLNEVFTDPKIVKVLHGADKDIEWLQRDLGLYIVNMFDTGQASRVLSMASYSLAYLLKLYFQVEADKQYQLADWRIRPLPEELVKYAQEDTHYLLHIYDRMKNELLAKGNEQKNLLHSVLQRSKVLCEKRYQKPDFHEERYLDLYKKSRKVFNTRQMCAFKELYNWRDKVARLEDESLGYVLPNHMLQQIAEILPREQQGILACCNPIPPLVKQHLNVLHQIIMRAREQKLIETAAQDLHIQVAHTLQTMDLENILSSPHDLSREGHRDSSHVSTSSDIVTKTKSDLFPDATIMEKTPLKIKPIISIFCTKEVDAETCLRESHEKVQIVLRSTISPYNRFLLMLSYNAANEESSTKETIPSSKLAGEQQHDRVCSPLPSGVEMDEDGDNIPLRNKMAKPKKRTRQILTQEDLLQISECPKEDGNNAQDTDNQNSNVLGKFQPFDYQNANYRGLGNNGKTKKKQNFFDEEHPTQKKKKIGKRKPAKTGSGKSFTYTQAKNQNTESSKKKWPKR